MTSCGASQGAKSHAGLCLASVAPSGRATELERNGGKKGLSASVDWFVGILKCTEKEVRVSPVNFGREATAVSP